MKWRRPTQAPTSVDDVPVDPDFHLDFDTWKNTCFLPQLNKIDSNGQFATSTRRQTFANPGLLIDGRTMVCLPLQENDVEVIKTAARHASRVRKDEIIDLAGKTWELGPSQFELTNPAWESFISELLRDFADDMGWGNATAELCQLVLREEGSCLQRYRSDMKKKEGKNNTLIVCLPAKHMGGSIEVSFGDQHKTIATAPGSAFDITALAWYSDVAHTIQPLLSGVSLVLTYSIIPIGEGIKSATTLAQQARSLQLCLNQWKSHFPAQFDEGMLIYPLSHDYQMQPSVSLKTLKGRDQAVCHALSKACTARGIFFLLAHLTVSRRGWDGPGSPAYDKATLETIFAPDGRLFGKRWVVSRAEAYDWDSEDLGDEPNEDGCYPLSQKTVAVLVSRESILMNMGRIYMDYQRVLPYLLANLEGNPEISKAVIRCALGLSKRRERAYIARLAVPLAMSDKDKSLMQTIFTNTVDSAEDRQVVTREIATFIEGRLQHANEINWDDWFENVENDKDVSPLKWHTIMRELRAKLPASMIKGFKTWLTEAVTRNLRAREAFHEDDKEFLLQLLESYSHKQADWVRLSFIPLVASKCSRTVLYSFLHGVAALHKAKRCRLARSVFQQIMALTTTKFVPMMDPPKNAMAQEPEESHDFLDTIQEALVVGARDEAEEMLAAFYPVLLRQKFSKPNGSGLTIDDAPELFKHVAEVIVNHNTPRTLQVYQLFDHLHNEFAVTLPQAPVKSEFPGSWARAERWCDAGPICTDCRQLNYFLADPDRQCFSFSGSEQRRKHLKQQLPSSQFAIEVKMNKRPFTLVVEKKPQDGFDFEMMLKNEICELTVLLEPLNCPEVHELLGEEAWRRVVFLDRGAATLPATAQVGQKRPAECLTEPVKEV